MKLITKLLLVCTLVLSLLVFTTFDTTYAEIINVPINEGADTSSATEGNKFIQYDVETQTESIITVEDKTNLENQLFFSPGKTGSGEMEKIDFEEFRQPNTNFVHPLTREPIKENISPNVIIGNDGRRQVEDTSFMPYRAMTYIEFGNLTSTWSCSGGVIGRDLVVTNAHCVEGSVLAATVVPGMNNNHWAYGHYRVTSILYPQEYRETENPIYDYAILRVATDSGGNHIGDRAGILPWREAGIINHNTVLKTYGYPGDKMDETQQISLWGMTGFSDSQLEDELVFYNMDTYFGQSGAPVLNGSSEMIAVHNAGYRIGGIRDVNGGPKIRRHFTNLFNQMNN